MAPNTPAPETMGVTAHVHVELFAADGTLKYEEWGDNLVTDYGDDMIATRMFDDAIDFITGMKLGDQGTPTAASKNGTGATLESYVTGSQEALDATPTEATKGAGAGWRVTHICTWIAGDVTNSALSEVVLTNETPISDTTAVVGDTAARYVFGSTIDKGSGDELVVTWHVDILGA